MRSDIKHIRGQVDKTNVLDSRVQLGEARDRVPRLEEAVKSTQHWLTAVEKVLETKLR